jgi:tyrosyl-tRNA synthetase
LRELQAVLAREITIMVHSEEDFNAAVEASQILFGRATKENLVNISEKNLLAVFDGVPQGEMQESDVKAGVEIEKALVASGFMPSLSEARRALKENSISVNKEKVSATYVIEEKDLIKGRYIVLQRGKKNYFLLTVK